MSDIVSTSDGVNQLNLESSSGDTDDVVDPWNVACNSASGIDYDKLIGKYWCLIVFKPFLNICINSSFWLYQDRSNIT